LRQGKFGKRTLIAGLFVVFLLSGIQSASGQTGGSVAPGAPATGDPATTTPTPPVGGTPGKATLVRKSGLAIPPPGAPPAVVAAIAAGNAIHKRPYVWGGGHAGFESWGYDCSGAVSYVLHAAGLLPSPLPSGPLMAWGLPGKGQWITVMANAGHTYAVVAGLRWDTSSYGSGGNGPRWRATKRRARGFAVRHYTGY
jgi:cell wall-associated NlpC family hydrolase